MPTRSIFQPSLYKQAFMIAACLMILKKILQTTMHSPVFLHQKAQRSVHIHFYSGLSFFFPIAFVVAPMPFWIPNPLKSPTKIAYLHSFDQKKRPHIDRGGKKTSGLVGKEPLPLSLSLQERFGQQELAFARVWQLEETVMSAILGWTVQCAVCRHLSSFSSKVAK